MDNISRVVGHSDRNASEQAHFLDLAPGQQYGLRHEYVLDQTLTAAGPRIYSRRTGFTGRENMTTRRRSCATGASGSWPCGGSARERTASNYN